MDTVLNVNLPVRKSTRRLQVLQVPRQLHMSWMRKILRMAQFMQSVLTMKITNMMMRENIQRQSFWNKLLMAGSSLKLYWKCNIFTEWIALWRNVKNDKYTKCTKKLQKKHFGGKWGVDSQKSYPQFCCGECLKMELYTKLFTLSTKWKQFFCAFFL